MSDLSKLAGKAKKIEVGGITLNIKPLTINEMDLMLTLSKEGDEQVVAMKELFNKVLKESVPDATDEEISNISVEHVQGIMEAITNVNNLDVDKHKTDLIAKIKSKNG